jgi:signal transduction histidine kinase
VIEVSVDGDGPAPEPEAALAEGSGCSPGIGLPTAVALARERGGQIEVRHDPRHGTVYRLLLPTCPETETATPPTSSPR